MNNTIDEGRFKSFDDTEIFFQIWSVENPKALVIGAHGLGEHSGVYHFLADELGKNGIQLAMFDHRGHGKSEGKRGVGTIDEYVLDLKIFTQRMNERFPATPYFFMGHSLGALVLIKYLLRNTLGKALGVLLSSPFLGVNVPIPAWKKKSAKFLGAVLPQITLYNEVPANFLTHDQNVLNSYEKDSLRHSRVSPGLYLSMLESIDFCFKNVDKMPSPSYFQLAGDDRIVSRPESEQFYKMVPGQKKKIKIYEKFYHEIYNELGRQEPLSDAVTWIKEVL